MAKRKRKKVTKRKAAKKKTARKKPKVTAIVPVTGNKSGLVSGNGKGGQIAVASASQLQSILNEEQARRDILRAFIKKNFIEAIHYSRTCRRMSGGRMKPYYYKKGERPKQGDEAGKMELLQDGAQTAIDVMRCRFTSKPDEEMMKALGEFAKKTVILIGVITSRDTGEVVGEGRGACSLDEKYGSVNNTIKQGQIRCIRNAVINTFALSDLYVQDVDDVQNQERTRFQNAEDARQSGSRRQFVTEIFESADIKDGERAQIESLFGGDEHKLYNVVRFIHEIGDEKLGDKAIQERMRKIKTRVQIVKLARDANCNVEEFRKLLPFGGLKNAQKK